MAFVAIVVALGTHGLPIWSGFSPGDRFVPLIVAAITLVLSVMYFFEIGRRTVDTPVELPRGRAALRVALIAGSIVAFALAAVYLGFVVAGALFVFLVLLLVLRRPVFPSLLAAAITTGIVYGVFVAWLGIRLPTGVLGI